MYYLSPDNKPLALGCNAGFCHYPARIGNLNPSDFLQVFLTFRPSGAVAIPYKIFHFHEFHGTQRLRTLRVRGAEGRARRCL
jgi:hypothetical protein